MAEAGRGAYTLSRVNPTTIAAACALLGSVLIVACVALFDWRWAIGVAGGFLLTVGLLIDMDRPRGKP